ncbi:MAG TPA: RDD family protein [Solirubrobacterales bacterium]|nr:RDD family protein [Solirubrobacterales bacterium]
MENGSDTRSAASGQASQNGASSNGAGPNGGGLPLSARLLGVGVRGARTVSKATGIDKAVEVAAEEAIVAAVESEAVERAMARVMKGPVVEEAVQGALESDAVKRAIIEAMDSELVDEVWRRLLASEETQQLVERIAGAPEVRAAISAQGVGLIEDIGRTIGKLARRFDDSFERIVRRIFFRKPRPEPTNHAGFISRGLAYLVDGIFVNLGFTALAALVTLVGNAFGGNANGGSAYAVVVGSTAWVALGSLYLISFWGLAGQTPGMRFLGIELSTGRLSFGRCLKRLIGLYLSVVTFGIGFLGVVFRKDRRAWEDRFSGSDVLYDERRPEPAPWSAPPAGVPVVPEPAPVAAAAPTAEAAPKPEPQSDSAASAAPSA